VAEPFNLDARAAARAEQQLEPLPVIFGGDEFLIDHYSLWPAEATEALVVGDLAGAFRHIMGAAQFDKFWAHHPTNGDLFDLMEAVEQHAGMSGLGERPRSRSFSAGTGGPLRPTSPPSTASTSRPRASRKGPSAKRPRG
jgi:hypothetical protein